MRQSQTKTQFVKDYAIQVHFPVFEQKSIKV